MNQNAQLPAVQNGAWRLKIPMALRNWAVVGVLVLVVCWHVPSRLVGAWLEIPVYSHGILAPFFASYLVWEKKSSLQKVELAPNWMGIAIVAFALGLLVLSEFGAESFVSRISVVILGAGQMLGFGGWQLLKELRLALAVLLLAVPIPTIVFNQIALPLQQIATALSTALLHQMGVPALRLGNIIELPSIRLEVTNACSGIRSLVSLFTLAVFFGYFFEKTFQRRLLLVLASIPIAIAANAIRIFGTGMCVQHWDAQKAMGFFHEFSGWVMFVVSLSCLAIVHLFMTLIPGGMRFSTEGKYREASIQYLNALSHRDGLHETERYAQRIHSTKESNITAPRCAACRTSADCAAGHKLIALRASADSH